MLSAERAPARRAVVSVEALTRRLHFSDALPWFVLRDEVGAESAEALRVAPAFYAIIRDEVRHWARRKRLPVDPDRYPHGEPLPGLPRAMVEVR